MADNQFDIDGLRLAFIVKYGREPGPDDPIFFAPDSNEPKPMDPEEIRREMVSIMKEVNIPAEIVYAYQKTGLLVTEDNVHLIAPSDIAEYDAAINEYHVRYRRDVH